MFSRLRYHPDQPDVPWEIRFFRISDLIAPTLSTEQIASRAHAVSSVIKATCPGLSNAEQFDIFGRLTPVARGLPAIQQDIVPELYMALAHLKLPEEHRARRENRIAQIVDAQFAGAAPSPAITTSLAYFKLMAILVPDAVMSAVIRFQVSRLCLAKVQTDRATQAHFALAMRTIARCSDALGATIGSREGNLLGSAYFTLPAEAQPGFLAVLEQATRNKLGGALRSAANMPRDGNDSILMVDECDALVGVLEDCTAASITGSMQAQIDKIVANQFRLARATAEAGSEQLLRSTLAALQAGVDFGPEVQRDNLAALAAASVVQSQRELRMTPRRLRDAQARPPSAKGDDAASPADVDPVHAWSVDRLLLWIEGPIADAAPRPLDRHKIVAQEKQRRQDARTNTKMAPQAVKADEDLTEADVELVVRNALCATARFFTGDIEDMTALAKRLNADPTPLAECMALTGPLRELVAHNAPDEQAARMLLHRAEVATTALREAIKPIEVEARTRQRFTRCLRDALASESLVLGKGHGGVIDCPMRRSDWPWVHEQFHQRWLACARGLSIDGVSVPLPADQALALYVTGTSHSGYEFDVSVHLWQRKPGCIGAPSTTLSPFAPMNTQEWIDTLTPCAVLHVPPA